MKIKYIQLRNLSHEKCHLPPVLRIECESIAQWLPGNLEVGRKYLWQF